MTEIEPQAPTATICNSANSFGTWCVLRVFNDFFLHGKILKGLNYAFIALIPQTLSPNSMGDFRPISLIGSAYKLIAKVLASRLQKVMPHILSTNQFSFTHGRQIADCIFTANEVIDSMRRRREGGVLLKIDFAKAYDHINWEFLFSMLKAMEFGSKWILWMQAYVATSSLAVLVNRSPTDFFSIEKRITSRRSPFPPTFQHMCEWVILYA